MEIRAKLLKPYTEEQRIRFVVENEHKKGLILQNTDEALLAWGYTEEELLEQEKERIGKLTMTPLDFINFLQQCGLTLEQIDAYLQSNLSVKMQLTYCSDVYCGVACSLMPVTIGDITITQEMVIQAFKVKNNITS